MIRIPRRLTTGSLAALIVLGLLPGAVLAAAPVAVADTVTTAEDTLVTITVVATDADGEGLAFSVGTGPAHGDLSAFATADCALVDPDACSAEVEYTPDPNFNGPDSFTFTADDGNGGTDSATVAITVTAVNDRPDAVNDPTNAIAEDTQTTLDVLANDTDPEGDDLEIATRTQGAKGTVMIIGGGANLRYTPNANQTGTDTFTYTVEDGNGGTDTATVTVQISSANDAPNAVDDPTNAIVEDITTLIDPLINDTDAENDSLLVTDVSDPAKGVATSVAGGTDISYDPDPNATGSDTFTYTISDGNGGTDTATVTVQISSVNDAPSGTNRTISTAEDTPYVFTLSDFGFTDPSDSPANTLLTVRIASLPTAGALTINGNAATVGSAPTFQQLNAGFLVFTPASNVSGAGYASFTFQVRDNGGTSNGGADTDPTPNTITIDVTDDNDPPNAVNDPTNPVVEDITTTLSPLTNDTDPEGDTLTITARTNGTKGTTSITGGGTTISYDPNLNATGTDTFTYTIGDGHGGTDTATVTVQISAVNDQPVAGDDSRSVGEDSGAAAVSVLGNDADAEGSTLTVTAKTDPTHGTLTLASGVLTYTPAANYFGPDSFGYTVSDGVLTDTATVSITVTPVNDAPVAGDDTRVIAEDSGAATVSVLGNDTDVDGPSETVTAKTDPAHGTLTLVSGVLTYTPTADYFGTDGFVYTVSDGLLSDTAAVTITITSVNDGPDAVDDTVTVVRDSAATAVGVLGNDTDVEHDPLLITGKTNGLKGNVAITGGGTGLTYDPFTGFNGDDTFTYTIDDGNGGTDTATVNITIAGANRAPNAVNDVSFSVPEGAAATALAVLANDDDPDGDSFSIVAKTNGAHGTVAITGGGTGLTYDPATLYDGTDSFTYRIRDAGGLEDTATVVVTVTRDTAAPIVVAPAQRLLGQTVGTTLRTRITWSATDPGSGIKGYTAQVSANGGTYATITLVTPTRTFVDRSVSDGVTYRFRVRATDREGNVSAWRYSVPFKPVRFQEATSLATYVGTWGLSKSIRALGGTSRSASTVDKAVTFRASAYDIGLVWTQTTTSGSADIYVDGLFASRINLRASSTTYRQLIFARHWATLGTHAIEIRPVGTGRIDIDAFVVLR